MAKNRKARTRAPRKARRRTRGGRRNMNRIPLQPFNRQLMNTVLRGSTTKSFNDNSLLIVEFTSDALLGAYSQIFASFREIKIQRVHVWVQTLCSTATSGVFTIVVAPKDVINNKATYDQLASTPGSISGRAFNTLHGLYYPTQPDERNWFPKHSTKSLFVVQFMSNGIPKENTINPSLKLQLVWDAHVRARGLTVEPSADAVTLPSVVDGYDMLTDVGNMTV